MALRFRELPWYFQTLIFFGVAVAVFLVGEMYGLSPVKQKREELKVEVEKRERLSGEVTILRNRDKHRRELEDKIQNLERELERRKLVLPDEKRTDDFMRSVQEAAVNSRITIRRLTAKEIVPQPEKGYAEMPIEIEIDGAYYSLLEFYNRLSQMSRVVNVTELRLDAVQTTRGRGQKYDYAPDTSVAGICVLTTYYYLLPQAEQAMAEGKRTP
ncbi:MAG: type 4a pilus biogenesis protein PilO [Terriglobia bacterium]